MIGDVGSQHSGPGRVHPRAALSDPSPRHVSSAEVVVDVSAVRGELTAIWASLGYDEINWTYRPQGKRLLAAIGEFSPDPFYVRPHYMFCSGSGLSLPHWGNGNVYHEDSAGVPFYDFTILDQAYDAIVGAGHHVLVELGFTPRALVPDKAAGTFPAIASPTR